MDMKRFLLCKVRPWIPAQGVFYCCKFFRLADCKWAFYSCVGQFTAGCCHPVQLGETLWNQAIESTLQNAAALPTLCFFAPKVVWNYLWCSPNSLDTRVLQNSVLWIAVRSESSQINECCMSAQMLGTEVILWSKWWSITEVGMEYQVSGRLITWFQM